MTTGKRSIKDGSQYAKYFTEKPEGNEVQLLADGDVYDTLKLMKQLVDKTLSQTKAISKALKGSSTEETCKNVWNFLYQNVQYKKDHALREQLRTPARSWRDRKTGIDCDCYSIFISSILTNLGIAHSFRMAAYKGDFQHVYVVVPKGGGALNTRSNYYVIDPVVDRFNYEVPYTKKHDQKMPKVTMLSGTSLGDCNRKPEILMLRKFVDTQQIIDEGNVPTLVFLQAQKIQYTPAFDNEANQSCYIITTPVGVKRLPTVMTKQQAQDVLNMMSALPTLPTPAPPTNVPGKPEDTTLKTKIPWWWIALGAGAAFLLSGNDNDRTVVVRSGLDGVKSKPKKKTYKTITI